MRKPRTPKQEVGPNEAASGGQPPDPPDSPPIKGPGSKTSRGERPVDDVRRLVLERIRERRLSIADISRALNKNDAYMHQFIWRGSPEWLGEVDRGIVCHLLEIPEAVMKPPTRDAIPPMRGLLPSSYVASGLGQRDIPLFREDDEINFGTTHEWAFRLPGLVPGPVFAIWIAKEHARFGPGDLIYLHRRQPPRVGDHVVAIVDQRITAVGKLVEVGADGARHIQDTGRQSIATLEGDSCFKVAAAVFA